ncbi:MAG: glycosyltransferase family 4 protein [Litorilinea sp.]
MQKKRILYIHGYADLYGSSRSLMRLSGNLGDEFEPLVILAQDGPLVQEMQKVGIPVQVCPWLFSNILGRQAFHGWNLLRFCLLFIPNIIRLALLFRREKADLIHSNGIVQVTPAFAAALVRVPHIWHVRETLDQYAKMWSQFAEAETSLVWKVSTFFALRLWRLFVRMIYWLSDYVVCVSDAALAPFRMLNLVEHAGVVHNGLEMAFYRDPGITPMSVQKWMAGDDEAGYLFVGTVGALRPSKGQHVLLTAFAEFRRRHPHVRVKCLLVGDAKPEAQAYVDKLHEIIQTSGIADDVILAGPVPDPRPAFARLDVFVLPSVQSEPFGTVVLEAMATETPLIATNIGGSVEQVEEGLSGLLVPPEDSRALADALERLILEPDLRTRLAQNALERVSRLFTIDVHLRNMLGIYRRVLKLDGSQPAHGDS